MFRITATGVAVLVTLVLAGCGDEGADRVRGKVDLGCSAEVQRVEPALKSWRRAVDKANISCDDPMAPAVLYARFAKEDDARADLLAHPPGAATCIAGTEIVLDLLDEGFAKLCDELDGKLVDAVSDIEMPDDPTGSIAGAERAAAEFNRRATRAQARALRAFYGA